ncbi:MAG: hypothetical protein E6R08_01015 [Nevskiaceae bacterium]|nr:MAG: hypothetical protein E6R08_01015 [Nevskiaceae bacterium]
MNAVLSIVLILLIGLLARALYKSNRAYEEWESRRQNPSELERILDEMLRTIAREGSWERVESMRAELHRSLHRIERHRRFVRRRDAQMVPGMPANKVSATRLAKRYGTTPAEVQQRLARLGYIEVRSGLHFFTDKGKQVGGEWVQTPDSWDSCGYMIWPADLPLADPEWATAP